MQPNHEVEMRLNVRTPMRDGVELSSDIYLPKAIGKFPTVLMRTPYDNNVVVTSSLLYHCIDNDFHIWNRCS